MAALLSVNQVYNILKVDLENYFTFFLVKQAMEVMLEQPQQLQQKLPVAGS